MTSYVVITNEAVEFTLTADALGLVWAVMGVR